MSGLSLIVNILIAYGALQAFFIALMLTRSKKHGLFRNLFAFLLCIEGVILAERLLVETKLIESMPHLLGIAHPISFLKPPIMFFMVLAITIKGFKLSGKHLLHAIPFMFMLLINLPFLFS